MSVLWLLAPVLSLLVLAAHFFRTGSVIVVAVLLAIIVALVGVRRAWVARLAQLVLVLGAIEWVVTLIDLAGGRIQEGAPVLRLAVILGVVALATGASTLVFLTDRLRVRYGLRRRGGR